MPARAQVPVGVVVVHRVGRRGEVVALTDRVADLVREHAVVYEESGVAAREVVVDLPVGAAEVPVAAEGHGRVEGVALQDRLAVEHPVGEALEHVVAEGRLVVALPRRELRPQPRDEPPPRRTLPAQGRRGLARSRERPRRVGRRRRSESRLGGVHEARFDVRPAEALHAREALVRSVTERAALHQPARREVERARGVRVIRTQCASARAREPPGPGGAQTVERGRRRRRELGERTGAAKGGVEGLRARGVAAAELAH